MAHFRATIQGMHGEASRLGTKSSGMYASIDGWDIGLNATIHHIRGVDILRVCVSGGSNDSTSYHTMKYKLINGKPQLIN